MSIIIPTTIDRIAVYLPALPHPDDTGPTGDGDVAARAVIRALVSILPDRPALSVGPSPGIDTPQIVLSRIVGETEDQDGMWPVYAPTTTDHPHIHDALLAVVDATLAGLNT